MGPSLPLHWYSPPPSYLGQSSKSSCWRLCSGKPSTCQTHSFQQLKQPEAIGIVKTLTGIHALTLAGQDGPNRKTPMPRKWDFSHGPWEAIKGFALLEEWGAAWAQQVLGWQHGSGGKGREGGGERGGWLQTTVIV